MTSFDISVHSLFCIHFLFFFSHQLRSFHVHSRNSIKARTWEFSDSISLGRQKGTDHVHNVFDIILCKSSGTQIKVEINDWKFVFEHEKELEANYHITQTFDVNLM